MKYYDDGRQVQFVREVLGRNPWDKQAEIIMDVFKYKAVTVASCNAAGKTDLASDVALAFLTLKPGSIVITTAPTWRQVKDVLWRYIRNKYAKAPIKLSDKQCNQVGLDYAEDWYAVGLSTKDAEKFFGYHADDILVIVDEASGVEEEIFIGVDAVTPNINARTLFIGNPTNEAGRFGKSFKDPLVKQHRISAFDTPNLKANGLNDVQSVIKLFTPPEGVKAIDHVKAVEESLIMPIPALISPGTVYRRYLQWGIDSPLWQALIMGQFPDQAEDSLFNLALIMKSVDVRKQIDDPNYTGINEWTIEQADHTEYGVDVARYGSDRTIVFPRRGGYVYPCSNWARQDTVTTTNKIIGLLGEDDYNSRIKIDDSTMGGGVTDQLIWYKNNTERQHYTVVPILFNNKPNHPRFYDMRAEMYWKVREMLEKKKIALPDDDELISELASIRYQITPKGQIKIEQKDEIKKRTGRSPDKADALVLAFSKASPSSRPETNPLDKLDYVKPITSGMSRGY